MASNQKNRFQSLNSSVEEFTEGQENENTKKKTEHDVALFHEFLVLKGGRVSSFRFHISNFKLPWNYFDILSECLVLILTSSAF